MTVLKKRVPTLPAPNAGKPKLTPPKTLPKGEDKNAHEPKKEEPKKDPVPSSPVGKSTKASKPVISGERPTESRKPRSAYSREEIPEYEGQVTMLTMRGMTFAARHDLWKQLNTHTEDFVTLLKPSELPRKVQREDRPGTAPNKEALFCPYCSEWMKFRVYSYSGYTKCTGCGISTRDFYTCAANNLWNRD